MALGKISYNRIFKLNNINYCLTYLQLSLKIANRFSEVIQKELGLVDGVIVQKPEMVEETKEPPEFFQGINNTIIIIYTL